MLQRGLVANGIAGLAQAEQRHLIYRAFQQQFILFMVVQEGFDLFGIPGRIVTTDWLEGLQVKR
jgi:hypothetical protein